MSQESSHGSQRVSDMAGGHRQAVARVIEVVTARLGETAVVPSELETERIQSAISRAIDEIFAEEEVPQGTSTEAVAEQAESELLGLGPLTELLQDPAVSSISAARFDDIVGTRDGRQQSFPPGFSSPAALDLAVRRMCPRPSDKEEADSVIEVTLEGGARLSALRGRVAPHGPLFSIHKPRKINSSLDDLVRRGAISRTMATFLGHCVAARLNILVVGPRDEGARTVLSALCSATNRERIITASDFDEIATDSDAAVRLDMSAYDGDARRLLEAAASVSQARLAVTLTSSTLIAATLEAMGSGMSGILASLRASNLSRALLRLPADVAAERPGVSLEAAAGWVLSGFDLAIEVARLRDGRVRVLRIVELLPGEGSSAIVLGDIFRFTVSRVAAGGAVEGHFSPSGEVPQIAAQLQAMGMRVEPSLFSRPPSR